MSSILSINEVGSTNRLSQASCERISEGKFTSADDLSSLTTFANLFKIDSISFG